VLFKEALGRNDGTEVDAYHVVVARDTVWRSRRDALMYTPTEIEFLDRMDNSLAAVEQDVAER
jgi:hypothetical protein